MSNSNYVFRSEWHLNAPPAVVYRALERLPDYPLWWPEIRAVVLIAEDAYELTCRSALPYELRFTTRQSLRDPDARILEARMTGDLEGFSRWTITSGPETTAAVFDEDVTACKALLRRLEPIARPAFKSNHSRMMRNGERGLQTYLAGYQARFD